METRTTSFVSDTSPTRPRPTAFDLEEPALPGDPRYRGLTEAQIAAGLVDHVCIYRAVQSDHVMARLVHEPVTSTSETIEFRNPEAFIQNVIKPGKRYILDLTFQEIANAPLPVVEVVVAPAEELVPVGDEIVKSDPSTHPVLPTETVIGGDVSVNDAQDRANAADANLSKLRNATPADSAAVHEAEAEKEAADLALAAAIKSQKTIPTISSEVDPALAAPVDPLATPKAVSPTAAVLADKLGLDPQAVTGTGPGGMVTNTDVVAHDAAQTSNL